MECVGEALEMAVAPDLDFTREPETEGGSRALCHPTTTRHPPPLAFPEPPPALQEVPGPGDLPSQAHGAPPSAAGGRLRFVFWLLSARSRYLIGTERRHDSRFWGSRVEGREGLRAREWGHQEAPPNVGRRETDSEAGGTHVTPHPLQRV